MWACGRIKRVLADDFREAGHVPILDPIGLFSCLCVTGEACWWTVHPASRQRSEGEKVRAGDDLILVNVSSERYLVNEGIFLIFLNVSVRIIGFSSGTVDSWLARVNHSFEVWVSGSSCVEFE